MILIDTPRLQMREFIPADKDAVFEFASCEQVTKYTGDTGIVKTPEDAEVIIKDVWMAEYERYGYGRYALIHKQDGKLIGFCGVKFERRLNAADIGYRLLPQYWGQGLASEAVTAAMKYAREELHLDRIMADAVDENIASNKILKNLGFIKIDSYIDKGFRLFRYESFA